MDEYQDAKFDLFKPLLELRPDPKMMERLSPVANLQLAAEIRIQAERIQAMAERLRRSPEKETVLVVIGELPDIGGALAQMESRLKETSAELFGLANREFSLTPESSGPPPESHVEAYFWRHRIISDLLSASSYCRLTAELLSLAVNTLRNVSPAAEGRESGLLLSHAATLLVDAAKQMGTAGTELGDHEGYWQNLERVLDALEQNCRP